MKSLSESNNDTNAPTFAFARPLVSTVVVRRPSSVRRVRVEGATRQLKQERNGYNNESKNNNKSKRSKERETEKWIVPVT